MATVWYVHRRGEVTGVVSIAPFVFWMVLQCRSNQKIVSSFLAAVVPPW